MERDWVIWLAWAQAVYFFVTGVWPIAHLRSFYAVTGPKRDHWLVKTVGALIAVVALAIGAAAWEGQILGQTVLLAAGSAAALGAVDVIYVSKRVIPPIYLADAVAEATLLALWVAAWVTRT